MSTDADWEGDSAVTFAPAIGAFEVESTTRPRMLPVVEAAAGSAGLITADMVKPGAAVLDAGVSRIDGKIAGDVAKDVAEVAGWLSPNPGGVGPMTRAMLLSNVVAAAERSA